MRKPRRFLVCGSRDWVDRGAIRRTLESIMRDWPVEWDEPTLMHGDARGADTIAAEIGLELGFWVEAHPADWKQHGKRAGILRNLAMLDLQPEVVFAFQRDGSRGTQHTIDEAERRGILVVQFIERSSVSPSLREDG